MYKKYYSKSAKKEFAIQMQEITDYCEANGITKSLSSDSYYFTLSDGRKVRVSNHTVSQSDSKMFMKTGEQIRSSYHKEGYDIEITASKTRLIEVHQSLLAGKSLNKRGKEISA